MKNKQRIFLYNDYDGKNKIGSDSGKIYIIDKRIVQQVLMENNLQKLWRT